MSTPCKIEFYFKAAEIEKLLKAHPGAKGIIISEEILREKPKGAEHYVNVVHIKARIDHGTHDTKLMGGGPDDGGIFGCPYPPGCTE